MKFIKNIQRTGKKRDQKEKLRLQPRLDASESSSGIAKVLGEASIVAEMLSMVIDPGVTSIKNIGF